MSTPSARPPTRLFDWQRACPRDVARPFPAVAGEGRGELLAEVEARRKMQDRALTKRAAVT